jgi:hypothetical protein
MMAENDNNENRKDEVYSKSVRAGKRTYFFDVKTTRSGENYLTITESKRRFNNDQGKFYYEKHKVFLYKEDFDKFVDGLNIAINFIKTGETPEEEITDTGFSASGSETGIKDIHTDVDFEDLGPTESEKSEDS